MSTKFPVKALSELQTPFYYYDTELLQQTLDTINHETKKYKNYHVHYAVKANACLPILKQSEKSGLGCDCVSGG